MGEHLVTLHIRCTIVIQSEFDNTASSYPPQKIIKYAFLNNGYAYYILDVCNEAFDKEIERL